MKADFCLDVKTRRYGSICIFCTAKLIFHHYQYSYFPFKIQENPHKGGHLCYNIHQKVVIWRRFMKTLIDPKTMRECELAYFRDSGVPSIELMENAARLMCNTIIGRIGAGKTAYFACGPGGNGGDGYACARMYADAGGRCVIFAAAPAKSADAIANAARCLDTGIEILSPACAEEYTRPDIWVDAIYGTGLSREPDENSAYLIRRMNTDRASGSKIVAADIPSGLRGDTGAAYADCVHADITVAFHFPKYGHYLNDGLDVCGKVISENIGFPREVFPENLPCLQRPVICAPCF